jgi:hypothetical protein
MRTAIFMLFMITGQALFAQLYINGDLTIQNGATLYADDTVTIDPQATVLVNGVLHNTRIMYTNFNYINTGATGFIITTIPNGAGKEIGIGTTSNNRVGIVHGNASPVAFKLAVRDSVYTNPASAINTITSKVVAKTWHIEPLSAAMNTFITPGWNSTDELAAFDRTDCAVSYWQNGTSTYWAVTSPFSTALFTGVHPEFIRPAAPVNMSAGVYYFGVGSSASALPVKFVTVNAIVLSKNSNLVKWQIANPVNGNYFEVERSDDGKDFEVIGRVSLGRNTIAEYYSFTDRTVISAISYYRIKQVDLDNNTTCSKTVRVENAGLNSGIVLYPNPSSESFSIHHANGDDVQTVNIYDYTGTLVMQESHYNGSINISGLASGIYYVQSGAEQIKLVIK